MHTKDAVAIITALTPLLVAILIGIPGIFTGVISFMNYLDNKRIHRAIDANTQITANVDTTLQKVERQTNGLIDQIKKTAFDSGKAVGTEQQALRGEASALQVILDQKTFQVEQADAAEIVRQATIMQNLAARDAGEV